MPYRMRKRPRQVTAPTAGLVADMVRQFADRYAFLRELVQNAIDAGASQILVTASYDARARAAVAVQDDGCGMTRDIIEGPLLTLFSSAKENDRSKIGKYGVGFVSVFAIQPLEVIVETWSAAGSFTLTLWSDHRYELTHGEARSGSGTAVTLVLAADADAFAEHVEHSQTALTRWCRHAAVPITLTVDSGGSRHSARIDTALAVPGVAAVEARHGELHIVASLSTGAADPAWQGAATSPTFAGFYCRGLTLAEHRTALHASFDNVRFKVDDPALQHTLSRDNVRHDDAYERAIEQVHELVRGQLRETLLDQLMAAARDAARGQAPASYAQLLASALAAPLGLRARDLPVPLCGAGPELDGVATAGQLAQDDRLLWSPEPDLLTEAAARGGLLVLRAQAVSAEALATRLRCPAVTPSEIFVASQPLPAAQLAEADRSLSVHTLAALRVAGAKVVAVGYTALLPDRVSRAAVAAGSEHAVELLRREGTHRWWRRWRPCTLMLVVSHVAVIRARALAVRDAFSAGVLLARYLLVEERGELSRRQNDALLEHALGQLDDGTAPQERV